MTLFSTLLSEYITDKNIRTYSLAQFCGVERTYMYKLINGKRNPSSEELVRKIADYIRLTPAEQRELLEAYRVTITGYETYYRRKTVQDFISHFSDNTHKPTAVFSPSLNFDFFDDTSVITGKVNTKHTIYHLISTEAQKNAGYILMLLQPDSEDFMETFASIVKDRRGLIIEHIICMNNDNSIMSDKQDYNLTCLRKIIPIYYSTECHYMSFYYYDNVRSHISSFNLMSSLIVTSDYAILFSPDFEQGLLFSKKEVVKSLRHMFYTLKNETRPIVWKSETAVTHLDIIEKIRLGEGYGISFQKEPCIVPLLPLHFPEKYLVAPLPNRNLFIEQVKQYIRNKTTKFKTNYTRFIFTEQGIHNILNTGYFYELPEGICNPLDSADRMLIIHNLISGCQLYGYQMLRPEAPIASSNLCVYATEHNGYLLFSASDGKRIFLNMEEPGIVLAFYDYLNSLDESLFYTTEETTERLRAICKAR